MKEFNDTQPSLFVEIIGLSKRYIIGFLGWAFFFLKLFLFLFLIYLCMCFKWHSGEKMKSEKKEFIGRERKKERKKTQRGYF